MPSGAQFAWARRTYRQVKEARGLLDHMAETKRDLEQAFTPGLDCHLVDSSSPQHLCNLGSQFKIPPLLSTNAERAKQEKPKIEPIVVFMFFVI